jgi:iron-sulfur cluster repair protein YtfE (RIC family)
MKVTFTLRREHAAILALFEAFLERAEDPTTPEALAHHLREARDALELHMRLEEEVFYPACEAIPELREQVRRAREDHHAMRGALRALSAGPLHAAAILRARALVAEVEAHVEDEEEDLFPRARRALGDAEIGRLGVQWEARRAVLTSLAPPVSREPA